MSMQHYQGVGRGAEPELGAHVLIIRPPHRDALPDRLLLRDSDLQGDNTIVAQTFASTLAGREGSARSQAAKVHTSDSVHEASSGSRIGLSSSRSPGRQRGRQQPLQQPSAAGTAGCRPAFHRSSHGSARQAQQHAKAGQCVAGRLSRMKYEAHSKAQESMPAHHTGQGAHGNRADKLRRHQVQRCGSLGSHQALLRAGDALAAAALQPDPGGALGSVRRLRRVAGDVGGGVRIVKYHPGGLQSTS